MVHGFPHHPQNDLGARVFWAWKQAVNFFKWSNFDFGWKIISQKGRISQQGRILVAHVRGSVRLMAWFTLTVPSIFLIRFFKGQLISQIMNFISEEYMMLLLVALKFYGDNLKIVSGGWNLHHVESSLKLICVCVWDLSVNRTMWSVHINRS